MSTDDYLMQWLDELRDQSKPKQNVFMDLTNTEDSDSSTLDHQVEEWYRDPSFESDPFVYYPQERTKPTNILFFADLEGGRRDLTCEFSSIRLLQLTP